MLDVYYLGRETTRLIKDLLSLCLTAMKYLLSFQWLFSFINQYASVLAVCFPNNALIYYIKNGMKLSLIACLILFKIVKQIKARQLLNMQININSNLII